MSKHKTTEINTVSVIGMGYIGLPTCAIFASRGLNVIGMKRSGLARADIFAMRKAYRMIFDPSRAVAENIPEVERQFGYSAIVRDVLDFLPARGKRHFTVPPLRDSADSDDDGD